jgi:hypothetical protein
MLANSGNPVGQSVVALSTYKGQSSPAGRATARPSADPKDTVEHAVVIHTRHAARLVRQQRLDGG